MEVVYDDNHIIIVNKQAGELVQGDRTGDPTLVDTVKVWIKEKYNKPGNVFLGLVHRLDRNVSGVMVFARTSKCASRLSEQIRKGTFEKRYRACVQGKLEGSGTLVNYLVKDERINKVTVHDTEVPGSKRCELMYEAGEFDGEYTTVDVRLLTGRSHQIRAQFAHSGHPLKGDVKYGGKKSDGGIGLMSCYLAFDHPTTGERLEFAI